MSCIQCNLAHSSAQRRAHTPWVSRNRSLVALLMNPSVILQLNYGWVPGRGTPLGSATVTVPSLQLLKALFLLICHWLCLSAFLLHHASLLFLLESLIVPSVFFFFFSFHRCAPWGMSCSKQALICLTHSCQLMSWHTSSALSTSSVSVSEPEEGCGGGPAGSCVSSRGRTVCGKYKSH